MGGLGGGGDGAPPDLAGMMSGMMGGLGGGGDGAPPGMPGASTPVIKNDE
jgi:hypothetical protein